MSPRNNSMQFFVRPIAVTLTARVVHHRKWLSTIRQPTLFFLGFTLHSLISTIKDSFTGILMRMVPPLFQRIHISYLIKNAPCWNYQWNHMPLRSRSRSFASRRTFFLATKGSQVAPKSLHPRTSRAGARPHAASRSLRSGGPHLERRSAAGHSLMAGRMNRDSVAKCCPKIFSNFQHLLKQYLQQTLQLIVKRDSNSKWSLPIYKAIAIIDQVLLPIERFHQRTGYTKLSSVCSWWQNNASCSILVPDGVSKDL